MRSVGFKVSVWKLFPVKAVPVVRDEPKAGIAVGLAPSGSVVLRFFSADETIAKRMSAL